MNINWALERFVKGNWEVISTYSLYESASNAYLIACGDDVKFEPDPEKGKWGHMDINLRIRQLG